MKLFNIILGLSALFVAGCAAWFSIVGIGLLFSGAMISTIIMASSLELGKLVGVSFLYRFWNQTTRFLRIYLFMSILTLMTITSLGIYGFLSAAYQKSSSEFGMYTQQVQSIESQKSQINSQIELTKKRLSSLNSLREQQEERLNKNGLDNNQNRRASDIKKIQDSIMELIRQTIDDIRKAQDSLDSLTKKSLDYDGKILELKMSSQQSKDILTFQFIADAFHMDLNTVVKWFILIIIFVFDPLAVCLVLSYNVAVYGQMNHLVEPKEELPVHTNPIIPEVDEDIKKK
jgi:hypothetical protein